MIEPPFFVTDREEPYRPALIVWMEQPSGLIVGQQVIAPEETEGAVARVLLAALERPLAGSPRRPDAIRVADASLAAEVRAALGETIPVEVGPTPELDAIVEAMVESMPADDDDDSYLEGGRIPPTVVGELFSCAEILYRIAPWEVANDGQVLRLDIPELGVQGACVSIIGALGESLGLLIFPSIEGYDAFLRAAERPHPKRGRIDLGTGWLALNFERGADLPASMRREVAKHGWPVAAAAAYPRVECCERDGLSRPLAERDLKIAAACAVSLSSFFVKHAQLFAAEEFDPVCESYFDKHDLEVRFTIPYEAFASFEVDQGPAQTPAWVPTPAATPRRSDKVGRNDPCPCGSGRKYKKCHLSVDEDEHAAEHGKSRLHDLDARMVGVLSRFADTRFGDAWRRVEHDFEDLQETISLAAPWSVYTFRVDGRPVVDAYLDEHAARCSTAERAWLGSQQAAWLSVWEVTEVDPGNTITLHDLLSDEVRCVREVEGSQTVVVRDALLARVVDHDGVSLLGGAHPRLLPPLDAAEVVRRARGRLRRKRAVPVDRLRDERFGRYLIRRWEEVVAQFDVRREVPPELCNTDGDPLILTTDHFEIARDARPAVEAQLAALEGVEPPDVGETPPVYRFLRLGNELHADWDNTLIGQARISGTTLELETNSRARADTLRARVEAACGDRIRHRVRSHVDPTSPKVMSAAREAKREPPVPEEEKLVLEFKRRHYADWIDHPLPALGGETPRNAARTVAGRAAVDVLLKDMENHERRFASGAAFDFSQIRDQLRLD